MESSRELNLPKSIFPTDTVNSGITPSDMALSEVDTESYQYAQPEIHKPESIKNNHAFPDVLALGKTAIEIGRTIRRRIESNKPHVEYLRQQASKTSEADKLPFTNNALYISQGTGVVFHEFGDSRSKIDANASRRRWWRNLKEEWTHEGAFVLGIEEALKNIGFDNVAAYPHAVEGDTTDKINAVFEKEIEAILADPRDVGLIDFRNGNDFREAAENVMQILGLAIAPSLADVQSFRKVYDMTIAKFTENTLDTYRKMQRIFELRKEMGRKTSLLVITQPPFRTRVVTRVYALGNDGEEDKYIGLVPPFKAINDGGATFIGGAFTGLKNALEIFSSELDELAEDMRLPIHVIPAGDIDDLPGTKPDKSVFDGSYHLSQLGHAKILQKILSRVVIVPDTQE